jgi:hypothetical protein
MAARSAIGWMVPISLLACITETSAVSRVMAAASAAGETMPLLSTMSNVEVQPRRVSAFTVFSTASCSILEVMMWRLPLASAASAAPRRAKLSASVPPLVNTTSAGSAPISSATADRASSSKALARWPKWCTLEALPKSSESARATASMTRGSGGVVAL